MRARAPTAAALYGGLDFQAAMAQQDARFVKLRASAQVLIQLRRFSEQVQRTRTAAPSAPPAYARSGRGASSSSSESRGGGGKGILGRDMSEALSTGVWLPLLLALVLVLQGHHMCALLHPAPGHR
jgi:hypothetical protein